MNSKLLAHYNEFLRGIALSSLGLMVGLFVAACGSAPTEAPAAAAPTEAPAAAPTEAPAEATPTEAPAATPTEASVPAESSGPQPGDVLRIGIIGDALSQGSPPDLRTFNDWVMHPPVIESLGRYDAEGNMQPWLATDFETDPEAKTVTITLREGVKFHDGTDFNAEAVKWNLEQFIAAERPELRGVTSIDVVDNYTVKITLDTWDNTILTAVGYFAGPMVSPTAYEKNGKDWALINPVGTGPFKFVSWDRDVKLVYEKNEDYWQEGKPYLDGLEWHIIKDPVTAVAAFKANEFDVFVVVPPKNAKDLEASGAEILQLETGLGALIRGVVGDSGHPDSPLADVKVRQAIGHAIDNQAIVDVIFDGYATATNQWAAPGNWSFNNDIQGYPYDPEKAKQLLAEAGYADGLKLTLLTYNSPELADMMTAIQGYLAEVGIEGELEVMERGAHNETVVGGTWEGLNVFSSRSDPDVAFTMPRVLAANGLLYAKGLEHPAEIEELLAGIRSVPDFETKKEMAQELQRLTFEENVIINPILVTAFLIAKHPNVHDDGFNQTHSSSWTPEDVWLEQ